MDISLTDNLTSIARTCRRISNLRSSFPIHGYHCSVQRVFFQVMRPAEESIEHAHACYEMRYIVDGKILHISGNESQAFAAGYFLWDYPFVRHAFTALDNTIEQFIISFDLEPAPVGKVVCRSEYYPGMYADLQALLNEATTQPVGWAERVQFRLAIILSPVILMMKTALSPPLTTNQSPDLLQKVNDYLRANLASPLTLAIISDAVGTSERTLCRHVHRLTGDSVHAMLHQLRMDRAQELLLEEPHAPLHSIARQCGYADPSYFVRLFRKYNDTTPQQYRERWGMASRFTPFPHQAR